MRIKVFYIFSIGIILCGASCASFQDSLDKMKSDFSELGNDFKSKETSSKTNKIYGNQGSNNAEKLLRNKYRLETDLSNRNLISLGSIRNQTQQKLLLRFIKEKDLEGVKSTIQAGANPNYGRDESEINHPLYTAVYWGQFHDSSNKILGKGGSEATEYYKIAKYLLSIVADKNAVPRDFNHSSLFVMCRSSESNCRKCVEEWGFDVNKGHPHMFGTGGKTGEYLIKKGLDIKYYDISTSGYSVEVLELLSNQASFRERIPLFDKAFLSQCDEKNGLRSIKAYDKSGTNLNTKCSACLYDAVLENNIELVRYLIKRNAEVNPQLSGCNTGWGETSPLQLALDKNKSIEIVNSLMTAGAK